MPLRLAWSGEEIGNPPPAAVLEEDGWPPPWMLGPVPATSTIPESWSWEAEDPLGFLSVTTSGTVNLLSSGVRYAFSGEELVQPPPPPSNPSQPPDPTSVDVANYEPSSVDVTSLPSSVDLITRPSSVDLVNAVRTVNITSAEGVDMPNLIQPMKRGDRRPPLVATLGTLNTNGSLTPNILTGTTVVFNMAFGNKPIVTDGACTILDAVNGVVQYNWAAGDTDHVGDCDGEFKVTDGAGLAERYPNQGDIIIKVTEQVGP